MLLLYIYLTVAGLGLVSMPSFHAVWKNKNPGSSWSDCNWNGEYEYNPSMPQPLALLFGSIIWPALLSMFIVYHVISFTKIYKIPSLVWTFMSLPGRYIAGNPPDFKALATKFKRSSQKKLPQIMPKKDLLLLEAEREIEEFLRPKC